MELRRISPVEAGIHPAAILGFLDEIEREGLNLHKFMMLRGSDVFAEGSYQPYRDGELHTLFSFSKSFTSTAVGFAVQDGLLSLDDYVTDFFPEQDKDRLGEKMKRMKVFHLITMNTGHTDPMDWMFDREDIDWSTCFLESEPEKEPGSWFLYNNRATYMLSVIVSKVTGKSMFAYLKERLFDPLGFRKDIWWETSPQGFEGGAYGLNLPLEDMAKFGVFLMNQGSFEGRQLLNARWFEDAVKPWSDTSNRWGGEYEYGYGYQFWRCSVPGIYRADGAFGQFCMVAPKNNLILVTNSAETDLGRILEAFYHNILPADGKVNRCDAEWKTAQEELEQRLECLEVNTSWKDRPLLEADRSYRGFLDGQAYALESNALGITGIAFAKDKENCRISLQNGRNTDEFVVSAKCWEEVLLHPDLPEGEVKKRTFRMGLYEKASVKGYFGENALHFDMVFRETPYCDTWDVRPAEDGISVSVKRNLGNKPLDFTVYGKRI